MIVINQRIKLLLPIFFIFSLLYVSHISMAANDIMLQDQDVTVSLSPENPKPYEDVTVSLSSFATDLQKAMIEWQNGGAIVLSGYGKTNYSFKALGPNTNTALDITITVAGTADKITKRVIINPTEVELIWEGADSYTPPFYRGKSFVSSEGLIKVVAIPNTSTIKQGKGSVSYTWRNGNTAATNASGYSKDSYVFKNSELNSSEKVTVLAESIDGSYSATNTIKIPIISPKILFYKKSPTEGVFYNNALVGEASFTEDELTIVALPYFSAFKGHENDFTYAWKINGESIQTPSAKTEITVRPTERGGYATISLTLENLKTLFQKVSGQLKLNL